MGLLELAPGQIRVAPLSRLLGGAPGLIITEVLQALLLALSALGVPKTCFMARF